MICQESGFGQGVALRILLHMIGDVHQPLHCVTRYGRLNPTGDAGGNFFKVNDPFNPSVTNLHSMWDSGAHLFENIIAVSPDEQQLKSHNGLAYVCVTDEFWMFV